MLDYKDESEVFARTLSELMNECGINGRATMEERIDHLSKEMTV